MTICVCRLQFCAQCSSIIKAWTLFNAAAGQSEKEERPATPEVSSPSLDLSCNLDSSAQNLLRRRKTSASLVAEKSPLFCKYPKVTATYPSLSSSSTKHRKPLPKLTKPPSSKPPVFLKCKPRNKFNQEETEKEEESDDGGALQTDLDIHLRKLKLESLGVSSSSSDSDRLATRSQSLTQYCNFEEKKVVKVAPHIRRKDVICDTVDAWSRDWDVSRRDYKPLIFGGTYPIDLPLKQRLSQQRHLD